GELAGANAAGVRPGLRPGRDGDAPGVADDVGPLFPAAAAAAGTPMGPVAAGGESGLLALVHGPNAAWTDSRRPLARAAGGGTAAAAAGVAREDTPGARPGAVGLADDPGRPLAQPGRVLAHGHGGGQRRPVPGRSHHLGRLDGAVDSAVR